MIVSYPSSGPIRSRRPYRPRLGWGLEWGFVYAAAASLWAIAVSILRKQVFFPEYGAEGMTLWVILVCYWIAGAIAGIVLGLLHPLVERRWGSVLVGTLLGLIAYGTVGIAMFGVRMLTLGVALFPALIVGGGLALVTFDEKHKKSAC